MSEPGVPEIDSELRAGFFQAVSWQKSSPGIYGDTRVDAGCQICRGGS